MDSQISDAFVIFSVSVLKTILTLFCCPGCKQGVTLRELSCKKLGLSICYVIQCPTCVWEHEFTTSNLANEEQKGSRSKMEVNIRTVMAFRNLGIGYEGLENFCMQMNMHKPMTRNNYGKVIDSLHDVYLEIAKQSMRNAAEEIKLKEKTTDIAASFDGSWQKPGHSSLNGIVSAISVPTGKVIDFEVKSKKCKGCEAHTNVDQTSEQYQLWKLDHNLVCGINHAGSSGKMEVDGVMTIYKRSIMENGLRYLSFIGNGDSSTCKTVLEAKPYGNEVEIVKKECIGHVQKRFGTRL